MNGQMTIFDWRPDAQQEPEVGTWLNDHGAVIPHIMRPGYIGKRICFECSTSSMRLFKVGILENIVPNVWYVDGKLTDIERAIVYTGTKQRSLVDLYPGRELFECLPWDAYPERMKAIGGRA